MSAPIEARLAALRTACVTAPVIPHEGARRAVLFLSWSCGNERARVVTGAGGTAEAAWSEAAAQLPQDAAAMRLLRADWIIACDCTTWGALRERLSRTKRNYFRLGIALDAAFERAFLETELNANAMLYGGRAEPCAQLNPDNFAIYACLKYGSTEPDLGDDAPVWTFATAGAFVGEDGMTHPIEPTGRNGGRRRIDRLDPDRLRTLIDAGSLYLADQVQLDGRFDYGCHPCFDRPIDAYNALRHASSVYAMLEAWEVTRAPVLLDAIRRALNYLTGTLIRSATLPGGEPAAFLTEANGEVKLGGNAVCLLALVKYSEVIGSDGYRPLLERLAAGVLHMQRPDGSFVHVLGYPGLEVREPFRIIYYDGEAAFGLMRLYELTGDARWLDAAERAFAYFEAAGHAKAHDHWLGYAVAALTRHRPEERWFRFALDNVRDHLDFVERRVTTFPTLLELMMASEQVIARLRADPAHLHLLDGFDLAHFDRAMHTRAHYLLNGHFWPELAMFFANPARITGSFFIRHHGFRVRIDDVEHYLSGLVGYRRHLSERHEARSGWSAAAVAQAACGAWIEDPGDGWQAQGLAIHAPGFRPGDMVAARFCEGEIGMLPEAVERLPVVPAAILTSEPARFAASGVPTLHVSDPAAAVAALGRDARSRLKGYVIGVTGSVGKTTLVAMLGEALEPYGEVGRTRSNANVPLGVAWNLASVPQDAAYVVLELAIGRMRQNAALARPDVAVFTDIAPAHLEYHGDLATIARRKARIFEGMGAGGLVVLNHDMPECDTVAALALARGLRLIFYGTSTAAAYRLDAYDPASGNVVAQTPHGERRFHVAARGAHIARNSLAVLAALDGFGLSVAPGLHALAGFEALDGRGAMFEITFDGRRLTIIDDSYNANPASMAAALERLAETKANARMAILGEMLELGHDAAAYHDALAACVTPSIRTVHTVGDLYLGFRERVGIAQRGEHAPSIEALGAALPRLLRDGDAVLFKGSHGSGIHRLVSALRVASHTMESPAKTKLEPAR